MKGSFLVILLGMLVTSGVRAEDCSLALKNETLDFRSETEMNLALLDAFDAMQSGQRDQALATSYLGYGDYRLSYDDAKKFSKQLSKLLDLHYTERQKYSIYSSKPEFAGYIACLNAKEDLGYNIVGGSALDSQFFLQVDWHPHYPVDSGLLGRGQKAHLELTHGKFAETNSDKLDFLIKPQESRQVKIVRDDLFEPMSIAVTINNQTINSIEIPPLSRKRLAMEVRKGDDFKYVARSTKGDIGSDRCYELPNNERDSAIVPGSGMAIYDRKQLVSPASWKESPIPEDERKVCRHIGVYFPQDAGGEAHVIGHFEARAITAIPK